MEPKFILDSPVAGDSILAAMQNLLRIGRFSKICRLTVKALRHYDASAPLRSLEMPLDGIRELLAEPGAIPAEYRTEVQWPIS
jgi:DNA-binding transcriptional MerR regulator